MATTDAQEAELIANTKQSLQTATDPLEKLRLHCLLRGASGIRGLARMFRIWDDNGDRKLTPSELFDGVSEYQIPLSREEVMQVFRRVDKDNSGTLRFDEFLTALRPQMTAARLVLIKAAFDKMDKTGDGRIQLDDIKGVYNVEFHPQFISREKSEDQILQRFLAVFDSPSGSDGTVTREEFESYYAGVSASIDDEEYFDLMMRRAWRL